MLQRRIVKTMAKKWWTKAAAAGNARAANDVKEFDTLM